MKISNLAQKYTMYSLVTGGAGFVGAHLAKELLNQRKKVIILDDLSGGFQENLPNEAIFIKGSILDHDLIKDIFTRYKIEYVYHLAAYAAEGLSHFIKRYNYSNNLIGSVNLINAAVQHKIKCFVFTSSIAVYGSLKPPMKETMHPSPEDPYGIAKLAVEQELKVSKQMFGLDYVIFRPHNVYGEYQNLGDIYRNVVGIFMNQLMQGRPLSIFGDGEQTRAFTYVGDIIPIIANSVKEKQWFCKVYNIGADNNYSINKLARSIMKAMGIKGKLRYVDARNEVIHAYPDHSKAIECFGDYSKTSLEEGLSKMANWAKKTGIKKSNPFKDIEIMDRLPKIWLDD